MNKAILLLAGVLFVIGVLLGAQVGSRIVPQSMAAASAIQLESVQRSENQQNILLVQINDLEAESPQVISLWAAFFYQSNPPQLMLLPLPLDEGKDSSNLPAWPALNSAIQPDIFVQAAAERYKLQLDGFVAIDDAGLQHFGTWFDGKVGNPVKAANTAEKFLESFCQTVQSSEAGKDAVKVRWSQVLPGHLRTNLSFDSFMRSWDTLFNSPSLANCELASQP